MPKAVFARGRPSPASMIIALPANTVRVWRRQGLAPQKMAGTGFTAQGFDLSSFYRRTKDSSDAARVLFSPASARTS